MKKLITTPNCLKHHGLLIMEGEKMMWVVERIDINCVLNTNPQTVSSCVKILGNS